MREVADESLMYAMANDEFIHIDESIVKINYVPYVEPRPINPDKPSSLNNDAASGGFNRNYLAFIPFGLICVIVLFVIARRRRSRSQVEKDTDDLEWNEVDWKGTKMERLSTGDDSARSDVTPFTSEGGNNSFDLTNSNDPKTLLHSSKGSDVFDVEWHSLFSKP